jgi:hypothetical protein
MRRRPYLITALVIAVIAILVVPAIGEQIFSSHSHQPAKGQTVTVDNITGPSHLFDKLRNRPLTPGFVRTSEPANPHDPQYWADQSGQPVLMRLHVVFPQGTGRLMCPLPPHTKRTAIVHELGSGSMGIRRLTANPESGTVVRVPSLTPNSQPRTMECFVGSTVIDLD